MCQANNRKYDREVPSAAEGGGSGRRTHAAMRQTGSFTGGRGVALPSSAYFYNSEGLVLIVLWVSHEGVRDTSSAQPGDAMEEARK